MYLWVVIATFMVALLSYNLSVRPDIDRTYMETKAQTVITKFKAQHYALRAYIDSQKIRKAIYRQPEDPQYVSYSSGFGYNNGKIIGDDKLSPTVVSNYLPIGYETRTDIYSKVFCFRMKTYQEDIDYDKTCAQETLDDKCCSAEDTYVFVVSWEPISSRWLNKNGEPISDMRAAIAKSEGYGGHFGYVTRVEGINLPVISGGMGTAPVSADPLEDYQLPSVSYKTVMKYQPVYTAILNDPDYQKMCDGKACLFAIHRVSNLRGY